MCNLDLVWIRTEHILYPGASALHIHLREWMLPRYTAFTVLSVYSQPSNLGAWLTTSGNRRAEKERVPFQWRRNQLWPSLEEGCRKARLGVKLQALVYDIIPSTTAVFSYAIGSRKLSANEHFFVGTVVSLLQTTQTKQGVIYSRQQSLHQHR